jgi:hypothetical protein
MDLSHTKLRIRCKIVTDKNETTEPEKHHVGPVNNYLHSLFSNVQIELNQKCITPQSGLYHYRAMIENLLNYGKEAKGTHLTTALFYKDTAGHMGTTDENKGFGKRKLWAIGSDLDMEGPVHCDIFNQNKYMVNGVQMVVKFFRNHPDFVLMSSETDAHKYKIKITEATLIIRKIKLNPALLVAHANTMLKFSAKYPITRVEVKNVTIPTGIQTTSLDNLFLGQLPTRIIIGFVDSSAFNPNIKKNPYNFEHFNHTYLNVATDAALHVTPLRPNYKMQLYISSYNTLFSATGINYSDSGCDIDRDEYYQGYNLSAFDLTPDISSHEPHWNAQNSGSLRIEVQFHENLKQPITAIIFAEFSNLIEIDRHRVVSLDYSA